MKIIIVGASKIGIQLAKQLITEKKDVILIEQDSQKARQAENFLDCLVINQEGNNPSVLKESKIDKEDIFISVTDSDEINIIACQIANFEFQVSTTIAKIKNLNYFNSNFITKSGISYIINPEIETAKAITNAVIHGGISDILLFEKNTLRIRNILVDSKSPLKNTVIKNLKTILPHEFIISAIFRNNKLIIPIGETIILENDIICMLATKYHFDNILDLLGKEKKNFKKILIVGGGKVGQFVSKYLLEMDKKIKIIEKDYKTCKHISETNSQAIIINSDISDEDIFEEENLASNDLIICTTSSEELNILTSIYAKSEGIKKSIALVNKDNFLAMASHSGIDVTISPKLCAVNKILTYIRKGNVKNIYNIFGGQAEIIEVVIDNQTALINKALKDIKLPYNVIILSIQRGSKDYIPDGNFIIKSGDTIIILAKKESVFKTEKLLSKHK